MARTFIAKLERDQMIERINVGLLCAKKQEQRLESPPIDSADDVQAFKKQDLGQAKTAAKLRVSISHSQNYC